MNYLNKEDCDVICLQEVLHNQYDLLTQHLSQYDVIGNGRIDGKSKGEYAPIFYKIKKFDQVDSGMFWLSETPEIIGSIGWDAKQPRIATWVILKIKKTSERIIIINTHLDDIGRNSRIESTSLIQAWISKYSNPIILTGDFNESPQSPLYKTFVKSEKGVQDTYCIANNKKGVDYTFHGFGQVALDKREKIDYIFVKGIGTVKQVDIPQEKQIESVYLSDHNPIVVVLSL